jgi:hypothetical protein
MVEEEEARPEELCTVPEVPNSSRERAVGNDHAMSDRETVDDRLKHCVSDRQPVNEQQSWSRSSLCKIKDVLRLRISAHIWIVVRSRDPRELSFDT